VIYSVLGKQSCAVVGDFRR